MTLGPDETQKPFLVLGDQNIAEVVGMKAVTPAWASTVCLPHFPRNVILAIFPIINVQRLFEKLHVLQYVLLLALSICQSLGVLVISFPGGAVARVLTCDVCGQHAMLIIVGHCCLKGWEFQPSSQHYSCCACCVRLKWGVPTPISSASTTGEVFLCCSHLRTLCSSLSQAGAVFPLISCRTLCAAGVQALLLPSKKQG